MEINIFEFANVLIVILLLFQLKRRRDPVALLVVLFVYGTLHFGFAAIALATNESANLLIAIHQNGSGLLAKLSTIILLSVVFFLLCRQAYSAYLLSHPRERKMALSICLVMAILACGFVFNIRQDDWLQLKNIISLEAMLALLLIGFLASKGAQTTEISSAVLVGMVILGITDCIAIYEVFDQSSWAGTLDSSGAMVYRASSFLFNPNLLAFWASLVYLACAYSMHTCMEHKRLMLWGMVLASIAIYFSGSRSAGYLLLGVLFIPALLIRERSHWLPLFILPLTMLTIYAGTAWLVAPFISGTEGWHEIALLGERFVAAPLYLINYVLLHVGIPVEVILSIEGRFTGGVPDAGWLVLYQDAGGLGLSAMLWLTLMSLIWGVRAYRANRSVASVYALAILCCCVLTGLVMRLQIFPVWLFVGIFLTPCLVFWTQTLSTQISVDNDANLNS